MHANLGASPGTICFDENRASWLPYWFDNVTESNCITNQMAIMLGMFPGVTTLDPLPDLPRPPAVGVPPGSVISGSGATPGQAQAIQDKLIADEDAAWKAATQAAINKLAAEEADRQKGCPWYQEMNSSDVCQTGGWKLVAVAVGGAAAALYFGMGRR
jgi:hypothetical protein